MDMNAEFKALIVNENRDGSFSREIGLRRVGDLPPGEVLIRVRYSSLNYKDALSAIGNRGVTKNYPHTPGIDAAGEVAESQAPEFKPGDEVLVTGYDLGMETWGGFGGYVRVPAGWVVPIPENFSPEEAMIYGTAGFTAGLSVKALLDNGLTPDRGPVLVTGATGGVGSFAVAYLARLGFKVFGSSGKKEAREHLLGLGAEGVIGREEANETSGRPLLSGRWGGVVDTVGGNVLATGLRSTKQRGVVTSCGNVGGAELSLTVYPFILRGVRLIGIDSAQTPMELRRVLWPLLAGDWKPDRLHSLAKRVDLEGLSDEIDLILAGGQKGRVLVEHE